MKKRIGMFCLVISAIGGARPAVAEQFEWSGLGANTDWETPLNWDKNNGFPGDDDEAVFVSGPDKWPTFTNDETVDFLTIQGNAELTVSGVTLTVEEPDGLKVASAGELKIDAGTLKLLGGGLIDMDGQITMDGGTTPGILLLSETTGQVYVIPTSVTQGAGIEGLVGGTSIIRGIGDAVLVIEAEVEIRGELTIEVALVNNGEVHANVAGDLTLACNEKSGNGIWKVSHASAKLVSNVPVSGGPCSLVHVTTGVLKVNSNWVSCGTLWMLDTAGKIEVAGEKTFQAGRCGDECVCAES